LSPSETVPTTNIPNVLKLSLDWTRNGRNHFSPFAHERTGCNIRLVHVGNLFRGLALWQRPHHLTKVAIKFLARQTASRRLLSGHCTQLKLLCMSPFEAPPPRLSQPTVYFHTHRQSFLRTFPVTHDPNLVLAQFWSHFI
jgi:hypothetical protein